MQISGKWVILFIFGVSLTMAVFAWSFQFLRGRRVIELWGSDNASLIRVEADKVELLVLAESEKPDANDEHLAFDGQMMGVDKLIDITSAKGLIHARQALIEDATFDWESDRGDCQANWRYALRFTADGRQVVLAIDTACHRIRLLGTDREAAMVEKISNGLVEFIDEQLEGDQEIAPKAEPDPSST